jgi:type IV pilus assembly protein PilA
MASTMQVIASSSVHPNSKENWIQMRNKQKGFSLIELLIVVAIILIIAAIAIPNLIRSKMAANEASAVASIRTINTSEVVYSSTYNVPNVFSADLPSLSDGSGSSTCSTTAVPTSTAACLIDPALEKATSAAKAKSGYFFTYVQGTGSYTINADPATVNSTGVRGFFSDQTVVIRYINPGPGAGATNSPI